ncbi:MAG TPA: amino acid adenylation domain-containing protein, partial [Thermoanaerobaculia bacterium]
MLEDTRAPVLLTEEDLLDSFPPHGARVLCLDRDRAAIASEPDDDPRAGTLPENLAYVIYTSGSTGRPKGAAIEHGSTVSLLGWARETFGREELAGVLASSSICFDSSVLEIFAPLAWGGAIVLAENALHLPSLPSRDAVRLVNTVPSAIAELLRLGGIPASVRAVSLAGEALQSPLVRRIYDLPTIARVVNLYGLSEATVYTTMAEPERGAAEATPIGRPIANTRVYLTDEDGHPVSPGVPGEIRVGGIGPGRGYVSRPELTAERFVPDPFGDEPGARLYRTGDLARCREDGTIDFLGRLDQQVKLRGFRIEPGEIEALLAAHPAIAEAVVQVREEREGDRRLVAYFVGREGKPPAAEELARHLAGRLPGYMVPGAFVPLAALPRTPNGKLDRKALPVPAPARPEPAAAYVPPLTPDEKKVARLWSRVLGVERAGLDDDFVAAGGHSLLATRLAARLREAFEVELSLPALVAARTVGGLARAIDRARSAGAGRVVPELRRAAPREGPLPLSFAQQRLWFLDQLEPGCAFYNIPAMLRLRGDLDAAALRRSLDEVVRRHEALRTTFHAALGEPRQVVLPPLHGVLPLADLGHLPVRTREAEALRLADEEARAPFDLARGPLLRATLLHLAGDDHVLLLTMHPIVSDGWSLQVLVRELALHYGAFRDRRPPSLPELPIQYADFARWQRAWLEVDLLREELEHWKGRLAGAPTVLELPADRPRPLAQSYRGARHNFAFSGELSEALRRLARSEGATLFMTLLAGFESLLPRYTGQ